MTEIFEAERIVRTEDQRKFRVNGQTFVVRPAMSARVLAEFEDRYWRDEVGAVESIELLEQFILNALEPGQEEAWRAACDPAQPMPLSFYQLDAIRQHIYGAVSGRPFAPPSDSGGSSATTGTTSTEQSASTEAT